jgi:hypothetical protein
MAAVEDGIAGYLRPSSRAGTRSAKAHLFVRSAEQARAAARELRAFSPDAVPFARAGDRSGDIRRTADD